MTILTSRPVRIDSDVWAELQRLAAEWNMQFAKPNDVLRRALGLPPRPRPPRLIDRPVNR